MSDQVALSAVPNFNDAFAELYESSPDCIKIVQLDGTVKQISPGGKIALELDRGDQLDGSHWPSLWPGSERPRVTAAIDQARAGKHTRFTAFCPTAKGTPKWWDVAVTPLVEANDAVYGLLVVSRDVTELINAKEELSQASSRKDDFLTTLSHEIRNPLSALGMAAKLLERSDFDAEARLKVAKLIARQVNHISRLAEDLLDISRINRDEIHLLIEPVDLNEVVQDAAEQLAAEMGVKNQSFVLSLPPQAVPLRGDRVRLTQIVGNLIGNASRYSPPASPIRLTLETDARTATISIVDMGKGITPEFMPLLFDMYTQGHVSTQGAASGVGMGLALVKGLVHLHDGQVTAHSDGAGLGSTFIVTLPLQ